ncbi:ABC transporter permease [Kitasatospora sp. NPDC092948]|uniref:ABC transporter permease n=1 Tax=Kitasatospora sp. NPDC092948 TaxID=3364088 RepID=UPI00381289C9
MTTPAQTQSGVIHDIGYRPYTGPRLGRRYATRSLYVQSLRGAFGLGRSGKSKVLPFLLLGSLLAPTLAMIAIVAFAGLKQMPMDYTAYVSKFGVLAEIFLAAQAPVLMSRDLRHHVVPLYFSRPASRTDYVVAKFGAMFSALLILLTLPLLVLFVGALLNSFPFGDNLVHLLYGLVTVVLFALVISALGLLIAAATPRRGFGVAAIMGTLMITSVLSQIVRGLTGGFQPVPTESSQWADLLSPGQTVEALVNKLFGLGGDDFGKLLAPGTAGVLVFAAAIVLLTAGSYALTLRRYRNI